MVISWFDDDFGEDFGSFYVFNRDAMGNWSEDAELAPPSTCSVGKYIAISGDTALTFCGHVYNRDAISGDWTWQTKLNPSTGAAARSGALDGDTGLLGGGVSFQSLSAIRRHGIGPSRTYSLRRTALTATCLANRFH